MKGSAETKTGEGIFFIRQSLRVLPAMVAPPSAEGVLALVVNHEGCYLTLWGRRCSPPAWIELHAVGCGGFEKENPWQKAEHQGNEKQMNN